MLNKNYPGNESFTIMLTGLWYFSTFRCNRNDRFVVNHKKSANIWLCLRKSFKLHWILGVCLSRKQLSKTQVVTYYL